MINQRIILVTGLVLLASTIVPYTFAGDREVAEFRSQYPAAVDRLSRAYSRTRLTIWCRPLDVDGATRLELLVHDGLKKLVLTKYRGRLGQSIVPEAETVVVGGDRYSFRLKKYHEKGDGYIIAALEKAGDARPQNIDLMNIHFGASGGMLAYAAFRTQEMDMKDLLDSKFCRIVSVESAPERSARTIRVKFSDAGAGSTRFTGIAEFLPDKGWALSRYEADSTASVQSAVGREAGYIHYKVASTVEYGDDVGGVPVPRRVQRTDDRGRTSIFEFDTVTFGLTPPKEEFTLSFFGLPDVTAPPTDPSRSNMMYWTLGAAVAALLSAVVVAMLGRNDRRNDTGGLEHGVMRPNL